LKDVYEKWLGTTGHMKVKSVADAKSVWRCFVEPTFGNRRIASITRSEVKEWASKGLSITGKQGSPSRIRKAGFLLSTLMQFAIEQEYISKSPFGPMKGIIPKLDENKKYQTITHQELLKLAKASGDYRLPILVAGLLGLRWGELVALMPEDFDFRKRELSISKTMSEESGKFYPTTTKSGKSRIVPIPDSLQKDLIKLVVSTPEGSPVFHSAHGKYLRSSNFSRRIFKPALKNAGLPDMRVHDLRHTAVTNLLAGGSNFIDVSKLVGHSKPTTTINTYAHVMENHQELIRGRIDKSIAESSCDRYVTDSDSRTA
jgi:integrase